MLTVIITTYNGAKTLPNTLSALCGLAEPTGGWKLVIVDNGSTDQTQEVIKSYSQRLPITVLCEARRGQNWARNSGLTQISGDLVVFTDDDVLPQPDWLAKMRSVADTYPSYSIFGGPVLPRWEVPPESWIQNSDWVIRGVTFVISSPTLEEGPMDPDLIWSPNMAVRSDVFEAGHRFDVTIGPNGSDSYPMGSETEFIRRMSDIGHKSWFCKQAIAYHLIQSHQMDKRWALQRAIRFGRGRYRIWAKRSLDTPALQKIARYWARQVIILAQVSIQTIRVAHAKWRGGADELFMARWWLNYYIGKAIESQSIGMKRQFLQPNWPGAL
jgi:glycosyltransferase involved in cell wall biosynthesis